ncbi:zinc-ribbon domain-containing protein [Anaerovibrio lipolyticus]|uniref:zinc-ribbon domain-containing protein n=1 Tax=Anaerovibrio lipolyticus TaxID=82374 RepID=UPI00048846DB|nr:zinc-ribbon domain-containing protein [Anaerovibrio lipolyticus]
MNEIFAKKCEDPVQFDKIRYLVHSLETERMHQTILEMCKVNPYLAVLCYNTAEQNDILREDIINKLDDTKINSLHEAVMLCLAWDAIDQPQKYYRHIKDHRHKINKKCMLGIKGIFVPCKKNKFKNSEWKKEPSYWVDEFLKLILRRRRRNYLTKLLNLTGINIENYTEELLDSGMFPKKPTQRSIYSWLRFIEYFGLYGKISSLEFDYSRDYEKIIETFFNLDDEKKKIRLFGAIYKLSILGFKQEPHAIEIAKKYTEKGGWMGEILNSLEGILQNNDHRKTRYDEYAAAKWWDEEKNGMPFHEFVGLEMKIVWVWWKCSCGYSWLGSSITKRMECSKCGERSLIIIRRKKK